MKKEITLGHVIGMFVPVVISILIWGNAVETRIKELYIRLSNVERTSERIEGKIDKVSENVKEVDDTTTKILIELQNKQDRQ